ncbi:hypothetical protein [Gemella sp. zg-1178]|uniref:hypothetical protein n=1 Tax=Gemella sp. zg-1178 TaxID=2840372 RepID=UPI001C046770|nr:hypothetical protein [Gemella sp. zg-1178]MBU0278148.1 hypothetical protein [Gemella sp. zg-1178]
MNKKVKIASAILASSLLITPISALVSNYDNVARAENSKQKKKEVVSRKFLSSEEHKKIVAKLYEDKLIDDNKKKEIESILQDRSFGGWVWVENFSDGAKDVHIPGWLIASGSVGGVIAVNEALATVAASSSLVAKIMGTSSYRGLTWLANLAVGSFTWDAMKNGIVLYYTNPQEKLICAFGNCYYDTVYTFSHMRIDY